jgi:putative ABC transport system ATP-binding protein
VLFELQEVRLRRGGREVLAALTAGIPAGATSVVGPSGSGKSTLLRLLNRLADPDRGTVIYRGRPLPEYDVLGLRREVSLVPQLPALIEGTVLANIEYAAGLAERAADADRCLALAGLDSSFAGRDVSRLSVGEQQRAMLARALVQEPRVLLLDEPTSALDEAARSAVEETLLRLRRELEISLVVVTHDPAQARRLGEWVVRVEAGRAVDAGPVAEVLVA